MAKPGKSRRPEETGERNSSSGIETNYDETTDALNSPTTEQIQQRAYEIYLERGGEDGNDTEDWLQAERELGGTDTSA